MNQVHKEEAELLNNLEQTLQDEPDNYDKILSILNELLGHTRWHFDNEQLLMKEVGFPAFVMHEGEHIRVFNEMQRVVSNWQSTKDNDALQKYFLGTLQEWLFMHIQTMDTVTAQFISMHKN
jgi:hemerythrin